jgi:hypothetical protein
VLKKYEILHKNYTKLQNKYAVKEDQLEIANNRILALEKEVSDLKGQLNPFSDISIKDIRRANSLPRKDSKIIISPPEPIKEEKKRRMTMVRNSARNTDLNTMVAELGKTISNVEGLLIFDDEEEQSSENS